MTTITTRETTPTPENPQIQDPLPKFLRPRLDGQKGVLLGLKGVQSNPPLLRLHPDLIPRRGKMHPPVLHYGFPFDFAVAYDYDVKYGILVQDESKFILWGASLKVMFEHILETLEIKSFTLAYAGVFGAELCLCICNNFDRQKVRPSEVKRLQAHLGLDEPAKWYVDHEMWSWGRKVVV